LRTESALLRKSSKDRLEVRLWIFVFRLPMLLRRCIPPPPPPATGFGGAFMNAALAIGSVLNRDRPVLVHRI
jgi:hypothetical protein